MGRVRRFTDIPTSGVGSGAKGEGSEFHEYRITLTPGPDILRRGINPLGVFDELRELGDGDGHHGS